MKVLIWLVLLAGAWPTRASADWELWYQVFEEFRSHSRTIYHDEEAKYYPNGYLATNELGHQMLGIDLPRQTEAGFLLGVGSTVNFSLAWGNRVSGMILTDISVDVMLAHYAVYRPLFLISESATEFLARLAGVTYSADDSLEQVAERVLRMQHSSEAVSDTRKILSGRAAKLGLSEGMIEFCVAAIQLPNPKRNIDPVARFRPGGDQHPFYRPQRGDKMAANVIFAHYLPVVLNRMAEESPYDAAFLREKVKPRLEQFDFLSPEGYRYVANLYRQSQVYYALGSLFDQRLLVAAGQAANMRGSSITDIYTSNIGELADSLLHKAGQFGWAQQLLPARLTWASGDFRHYATVITPEKGGFLFSANRVNDQSGRDRVCKAFASLGRIVVQKGQDWPQRIPEVKLQ